MKNGLLKAALILEMQSKCESYSRKFREGQMYSQQALAMAHWKNERFLYSIT
jgi:hypothetical protein